MNGVAAGAGAVIALACDFRVLSEKAKIAFLFVKVGLAGADMGAAWLLPQVVGLARATELLMLGEPHRRRRRAARLVSPTASSRPSACSPRRARSRRKLGARARCSRSA